MSRQQIAKTGIPSIPPESAHSPDFVSVLWRGVPYEFSGYQAAIVRVLWEALEQGTPTLLGRTILEKIGSKSEGDRIAPYFHRSGRGKHPAWKTMIVPGGAKSTYRLKWENETS